MKYKGLTQRILKLAPFFLAAVLWCILAFKEQFFLKKVEDLSVFLFDWLYFKEALQIPGGFLGVMGSFLTQFLYLPWLGALLWVLLLLIAYQLTISVFRIPDCYRPLALIPVALLIIGNMSLGYGVFIMREQDHFFAPTLGYIISLVPIITVNHIKPLWGKNTFLTFWTAIGFPLFGTFALVGTLSAAFSSLVCRDELRSKRNIIFITSCILILIVPLIAYNFYTSYRLADSWHLGLPSISKDVWTRAIRTPYQLALLFLPVMALAAPWFKNKKEIFVIPVAVFILSIAAIWGFWFKDDNFHTELAMSEAVDRFDWKRTIDIFQQAVKSHSKSDAKAYASRTKKIAAASSSDEIASITERYADRFFEPTRTMVIYRDLALLKTNRALNESFTMKDGGRPQKAREQVPMAFQSGKQLYLQYGLVNMSYRWCLEDVIEHNWSYGTLKYMAMHCIVMQESEFAYKYLNKLSKTIFYRKWAKQQMPLSTDSASMVASEPYKSILPYMCFEDRMTNDMVKSEMFIIRHFSEPEPPHATPEYDRAALFWAMRIQNIPQFWNRLYYYVNSNQITKLPRSVQEAAILYNNLEKNGRQIPYDEEVVKSYDAFNQYVQSHTIRSMQESSYPYYKKFGKTFYYYYYFIRNLQTY